MFHEFFDYPKVKPIYFLVFLGEIEWENINKISFVIKTIKYPCGVDLGPICIRIWIGLMILLFMSKVIILGLWSRPVMGLI